MELKAFCNRCHQEVRLDDMLATLPMSLLERSESFCPHCKSDCHMEFKAVYGDCGHALRLFSSTKEMSPVQLLAANPACHICRARQVERIITETGHAELP